MLSFEFQVILSEVEGSKLCVIFFDRGRGFTRINADKTIFSLILSAFICVDPRQKFQNMFSILTETHEKVTLVKIHVLLPSLRFWQEECIVRYLPFSGHTELSLSDFYGIKSSLRNTSRIFSAINRYPSALGCPSGMRYCSRSSTDIF